MLPTPTGGNYQPRYQDGGPTLECTDLDSETLGVWRDAALSAAERA